MTSGDGNSGAGPAEGWLLKLGLILASHGSVVLAGWLLIRFMRKKSEADELIFSRPWLDRLLRRFAIGGLPADISCYRLLPMHSRQEKELGGELVEPLNPIPENEDGQQPTRDVMNRRKGWELGGRRGRRWGPGDCLHAVFYFIGIESTLVCMGYFQERIITQDYPLCGSSSTQKGDHFQDAQFLVLANRLVALTLSGAWLAGSWRRQPAHTPPFYLHSFSSLSNIISSWCQYEALKYVSFPTQSVCKASKIIPTMVMGKILRRQRYTRFEYGLALTLVLGASLFFLSMSSGGGGHSKKADDGSATTPMTSTSIPLAQLQSSQSSDWITGLSGAILMLTYLTVDAFTPNWQKKLLDGEDRKSISTTQMMFAVNAFSVLFCLVSLLEQWTLFASLRFVLAHERILVDCLLLSLGSACGQLFIYATIERFGPVMLSVLMTVRQIFSILLSAFSFGHPLTIQGLFGLVLVFGAIFLDIFRKYRKQAPAAPPPSAVTATPQRAAVSPNGSSNQQQM